MKFRILRDSALITAAVLAGGKANAQLIDLDASISRSGNAEGTPRIFDSIGIYSTVDQTRTDFGDRLLWSDFSVFSGIRDSVFVAAPIDTPIADLVYPATDPGFENFFPAPARGPFSFDGSLQASSYTEFSDLLFAAETEQFLDGFGEYYDECYQVSEGTSFLFGVSRNATAHSCDALNLSGALDGVGFTISAAEDDTEITISIPTAGINFTSAREITLLTEDDYDAFFAGTFNETDTTFEYDRNDAFAQFEGFLIDTGASRDLAAAFLGVPVSQLPDAGTLPTDGDFFGFDFNTASAVDPGDVYSLQLGASSLGEILGYAALNLGQEDAWDFSRLDTVEEADAADLTLTFLGVSATLDKEANNPNLELISNQLGVEFATTSAIDLDDALEQVGDYIAANEDELTERFTQAVQEVDIATDPTNVVAGNPKSLQGQFTQTLLSLDSPSSLLLETNPAAPSEASSSEESDDDEGAQAVGGRLGTEPAWLIGGRIGTVEAGEEEGVFVDVVAERGFRVGEGGRNRIKVSAPLSYLDFNRIQQSTASVNVGYEHQVIDGKWVVEPSVGAGYAFTNGDVLAGEFEAGALWSAGLSSRLKVANVGRGHIIVGNAVGYSETFDIEVEGSFRSPEVNNTTFRNGVAYQVPVGQRVFDRLGTMRASYTHTKLTGTDVAVDEYHDISFNYGVGSRESTVRNFQETLRVGLNATFGDDYQALSLVAGYKF